MKNSSRGYFHKYCIIESQRYITILIMITLMLCSFSLRAGDVILQLAKIDNDPAAQYFLGRRYLSGNGVSKNASEAADWFLRAAKQGHKNAQYEMGLLYKNGLGVKKDYQTAFDYFNSAADQGQKDALFELGNYYFFGLDGPPDIVQSLIWYKNAAEKNHGAAQYQLGKIYKEGIGVKVNKKLGKKWLDKARSNGAYLDIDIAKLYSSNLKSNDVNSEIKLSDNPESSDVDTQYKIGMGYLKSSADNVDYNLAARWLREAANNEHAGAQYQLGKMYRDGIGVEPSIAEAIKWFKKAAEWDLFVAKTALNHLKEQQLIKYMKDYPSGPDITSPVLQFNVAMLYLKGKGLKKNTKKAFSWMNKSAQQNHHEAQHQLGMMYLDGTGAKKNSRKAHNWLKKSAYLGNDKAKRKLETLVTKFPVNNITPLPNTELVTKNLNPETIYNNGIQLLDGKGVEKNTKQALEWLTIAANKQLTKAQLKLAEIYSDDKYIERDYIVASSWYRKAAKSGDADAQYQLGKLYKKGLGVGKSNADAVKWFRLAARQGHENARNKLGGCKFC